MNIRDKSLQVALVSALALGLAGPAFAANPCGAKNPCAVKAKSKAKPTAAKKKQNPCAANPCAAKK